MSWLPRYNQINFRIIVKTNSRSIEFLKSFIKKFDIRHGAYTFTRSLHRSQGQSFSTKLMRDNENLLIPVSVKSN